MPFPDRMLEWLWCRNSFQNIGPKRCYRREWFEHATQCQLAKILGESKQALASKNELVKFLKEENGKKKYRIIWV